MKTLITLIILATVSSANAIGISAYHVGNSHTADAQVYSGLVDMTQDAGYSHTYGMHIRCGNPLKNIVADPSIYCVTPNAPFGAWNNALANYEWDAVTFQPYSGSTPNEEYLAFKTLVTELRQNPVNHDTRVYLYASWSPNPYGSSLADSWYNSDPFDPYTDGLTRKRAEYEWIFNQLINDPDLAGVDLRFIPAGDVLSEVDARMRDGIIPTHDLYRDVTHLSNLGRWSVANTIYMILYNQDPHGIPANSRFDTAPGQVVPIDITPELALQIQDVVWDVISTQSVTGFLQGDINLDGFVGIDDLNIVLQNWNTDGSGDPRVDRNGDGFVGLDDLNRILENWNAGTPPAMAATPEPGTLLLLGCGFVSLSRCFMRR